MTQNFKVKENLFVYLSLHLILLYSSSVYKYKYVSNNNISNTGNYSQKQIDYAVLLGSKGLDYDLLNDETLNYPLCRF